MHGPIQTAIVGDRKFEVYYDDSGSAPRGSSTTSAHSSPWESRCDSPDDNEWSEPDAFISWWRGSWSVLDADGDVLSDGYESEDDARENGLLWHRDGRGLDADEGTVAFVPGKGANGGVLLNVYKYDHSGVAYRAWESNPFSCPWDSGQVGFIFATAEAIRENWSGTRADWWDKTFPGKTVEEVTATILASEVEAYSLWANGEVYGFVAYTHDPDKGCAEWVVVDEESDNNKVLGSFPTEDAASSLPDYETGRYGLDGPTDGFDPDCDAWVEGDSCWGFIGELYGDNDVRKAMLWQAGVGQEEMDAWIGELG